MPTLLQKSRLTLAGFLLAVSFLAVPSAMAHDLSSPEMIQFMQENPELTLEEFQAYLDEQHEKELALQGEEAAERILGVRDADTPLSDVISTFIRLGIEHILIGTDHILFVLALLLVFTNWVHILKLVTSFTVAHSITLILAGTGFFALSGRIVEPLIALSISFMAITSVFFRKKDPINRERTQILTVFLFGLFHGLGFAGLLGDFSIPANHFLASLLSFNVGVEIGQLIILGIALPFIYLFRRKSWYPKFIQLFAFVIASVGFIWFVERAFEISIIS